MHIAMAIGLCQHLPGIQFLLLIVIYQDLECLQLVFCGGGED